MENYSEAKLDNLRYDKTYRAKITADKGGGIYTISINGKEYDINGNGETYTVGSVVRVKSPLNNFSDFFIISNVFINSICNCINICRTISINESSRRCIIFSFIQFHIIFH